jgi:hypothetical protein
MLRWSLLFAAIALSVSCSPQPEPPHVVTVDVTPSATVAAAQADAGRAPPADPADLRNVQAPPTSCSMDVKEWNGAISLRVASDGPAYATLPTARAAHVALADGAAFFTADTGSAHVGGFVALDGLHLGTRIAVAFGGFYAPNSSAPAITLAAVAGDHATLEAATPPDVELLGATPLRADVACADLSLEGPSSDTQGLFDFGATKRARIPAHKKIAVSLGPGDAPVARITTGADAPQVTVIDEQAGRARVVWWDDSGTLFGWVARGDLRMLGPESLQSSRLAALREAAQFGMMGLLGSGTISGGAVNTGNASGGQAAGAPDAARAGEHVACVQPARLVAEIAGRRYVVGRIDAAGPFTVHRTDTELAPVEAPGSLEPAQGASLLVPSRDVFACGTTTSVEASDPPRNDDPAAIFGGLGNSGGGVGVALGGLGASGGLGAAPPGPRLRMGATSVTGRLPPEVIQRIVRQNFGRFRLCYEAGLRKNPKLQGRVATRFVIDSSGAVSSTADAGSDLPNATVVACVVRSFSGLSFPQPEAGAVTVVFPVIFEPGD